MYSVTIGVLEPYKNYLDGGQIATGFAGPGIVLGGMIHHLVVTKT